MTSEVKEVVPNKKMEGYGAQVLVGALGGRAGWGRT